MTSQELTELNLADQRVMRGIISVAGQDQFVIRVRQGDEEWLVTADPLYSSETPLRLRLNDHVLCWIEYDDRERGVILGRIGTATTSPVDVSAPEARSPILPEVPDSIVLEAKHSLTLRVGEGSITIREDGKILIKGKDLVSHAQRLNRIKGGAVQIN